MDRNPDVVVNDFANTAIKKENSWRSRTFDDKNDHEVLRHLSNSLDEAKEQ